MAYPQPGQYPAYPQYPGSSGVPQMPRTVQNAFYLMLAGAALQLLAGVIELATISKFRDAVRRDNPLFTGSQVDTAVHAVQAGAVIGIVIGMGLWIWMAFANRGGANWARIVATVFFGIYCLEVIGGLAVSGSNTLSAAKDSPAGVVILIVEWLVALGAILMLWNKQSGPYFNKAAQYGQAPYPYPYPIPPQQPPVPGAPGAAPQPPYGTQQQPPYGAQQPPSDPWGNPPQ